MKIFTKLRVAITAALLIGGMASVWGQTLPLSATSNISKQGTDAAGAVAGTEDPDLVTTGTQVIYLVKPDADLSPSWAASSDARNTIDLSPSASWAWTVPTELSNTFVPATNVGHFILLNVNGARDNVTRTINVKEKNGSACIDGTGTNINVKIVSQPNATLLAVNNASTCGEGTNGSLGVALPVYTLTKSTDSNIPGADHMIKVKASLSFTSLVSSVPNSTIFTDKILSVNTATGVILSSDIVTATGVSGFTLDNWGTYTLTISQISDKISRKDMDATRAGYFDVNGGTPLTVAYTVLKQPKTGDIYRLPNN